MLRLLMPVLALALASYAPAAHAATIQFDAYIDGLQETPPVVTPGTGNATLFLDDSNGNWTLSGTFQDLVAAANNAHIHGPAAIGVGPAGVIAPLTFTAATSGTISGAGTFTPTQMSELLSGLYYINIHSSFKPGGEIRGQLLQVPEPNPALLLALGLVVLARRRVVPSGR